MPQSTLLISRSCGGSIEMGSTSYPSAFFSNANRHWYTQHSGQRLDEQCRHSMGAQNPLTMGQTFLSSVLDGMVWVTSEQDSRSITPRHEWFHLQSPIGVIGGFAAIVEVAIIFAAIFVDGPARWALIIFAAAAFFYMSSYVFMVLLDPHT
jgi:hypothetical protein